jgi:tetratricopeptide (TPR) repeat protein
MPGAIEAMKLAVDAGAPGDENTEWCRVQIGKLYEQLGRIKEAEMQHSIALGERENFPHALIGLARIATAQKDYTKALSLFMQADSVSADHTIKEGIAEVYSLMGETDKSKEMAEKNIEHMKSISMDGNEDLETAHAYIGVGRYDKALEHAMIEYKRRPNNIEANETVAIVYYKKTEYTKAVPFIEAALKTNCKKPELLCNAGMIYAKAGDKAKAKMYLHDALKNDPLISASVKIESEEILNSLK